MTLGTTVAQLSDEAFVEQALAALDDIVLLARLRAGADKAHEPLGAFITALVGHFVLHANDEAWLSLITAANQARDPAAAILHRMLVAA
jgi:hypothetical protein